MLNFLKSSEICPRCKESKEDCAAQQRNMNWFEFGVNLFSFGHYHKCHKEIYSLGTVDFTPSESLLGADHKKLSHEKPKVVSEVNKMFHDEDYGEYSESESDSDSDSDSDNVLPNAPPNAPLNVPPNVPSNAPPNAPPIAHPNALHNHPKFPVKPNKMHKYQLSKKKKAFVKKSVMMIPEKNFDKNFSSTYYFKAFNKTERYPPVKEAVDDLKKLFSNNKELADIVQFYHEMYIDSDVNVITGIWTESDKLTCCINAGLILDAVEAFGKDVYKNVNFFKKVLAENKTDYKTVIDLSIKFMRLLNTFIVDLGTMYNTEDRVVYRGVRAEIFSDVKEREIIRMIGWNCASDVLDEAVKFETKKKEDKQTSSLVKFNVKAMCFNAGQLNHFGFSSNDHEKETLIPPYSACICIKKEQMVDTDFDDESFDTNYTKEEVKGADPGSMPMMGVDKDKDSKKKADVDKTKRWKTVFVMNLARDNKNIQDDLRCSF
ncbi:unnamed protein product [Moneuplotes crassus]|uniref:Uncharacterized protein n=1 Tax=Euplotes crassus TaxID=5936 RepID=A0AAD2D8K2_EUPCR|nr:unnamed protein product [Moneuplotes crassus]